MSRELEQSSLVSKRSGMEIAGRSVWPDPRTTKPLESAFYSSEALKVELERDPFHGLPPMVGVTI